MCVRQAYRSASAHDSEHVLGAGRGVCQQSLRANVVCKTGAVNAMHVCNQSARASLMIRSFILCAFLSVFCAASAGAVVRVSHDNGAWESISWFPAGVPGSDDTVVIASDVTGMPAGIYRQIVVRAHGSLRLDAGGAEVAVLQNEGRIAVARSAMLHIVGELRNAGSIAGEGIVRMAADGGRISGSGTFGHILVGGVWGSVVRLDGPVVFGSLTVAGGNQLVAGPHDLTVNGAYVAAASRYGDPGVVADAGVIRLNGEIDGNARGDIIIGSAPEYRPSRRGTLLSVRGVLGDTGRTLRFAASRQIGFSTLLGDVRVDPGTIVRATGIGLQGGNTIVGSLTVDGVLAASEELYRWNIIGDLYNYGTIEHCTVLMQGHRVRLRSDAGIWDPAMHLIFKGDAGGELAVMGPIVVATLAILPLAEGDSNIVVHAGGSPIKVRHRFTSDIASGCRIVSDTVVKLWGEARGIVEGDVTFEGFWGSPVGGRYGAVGKEVRFLVRKEILTAFEAVGCLRNAPAGHILVGAPAAVHGMVWLQGELTIPAEQALVLYGDTLRFARTVRGGGAVQVVAPHATLEAAVELADSVIVDVGRIDAITSLTLERSFSASRIRVNPGSVINYRAGTSLVAGREFCYGVRYQSGFNSASAACLPFDPGSMQLFATALSVFGYRIGGCVPADTITPGDGYFVRFPEAVTVWHRGDVINLPRLVLVRAGWNLIGGASVPVQVARIVVQGTTLLSGYLATPGDAVSVSTLEPGYGYWVNVAGDGALLYEP